MVRSGARIRSRLGAVVMATVLLAGIAGGGAPALAQAGRPMPAVPQPETILILIRTTLVALAHANDTGNYTVLRDLGAPGFHNANTATKLAAVFSALRDQRVDLKYAAIATPQVTKGPAITQNGQLHFGGFLPAPGRQINFEMLFEPAGGVWRLFGLAVNASAPVAASQPAPAVAPAAPEAEKPKREPARKSQPAKGDKKQ